MNLIESQLEYIPLSDLAKIAHAIKVEIQKRSKKIHVEHLLHTVPIIKPTRASLKGDVFKYNSSGLYSLPNLAGNFIYSNSVYLPALIMQDWSHIYLECGGDNSYYVYAHVNPTKKKFCTNSDGGGDYGGTPFYIGKGSGDRAFNLTRNQGHGKILKELLKDGVPQKNIAKIIFNNLTESKAYELEAKLIYYFGSLYADSKKKKGTLINLDIPSIPSFIGAMKKFINKREVVRLIHADESFGCAVTKGFIL